jgi:hypothetical protein
MTKNKKLLTANKCANKAEKLHFIINCIGSGIAAFVIIPMIIYFIVRIFI